MTSETRLTSSFDGMAASYAEQWSQSVNGAAQREEVWREIDTLFQPRDRLLDLGCGIGDDAVYLADRGVQVIGIDASEKMVEIACSRGVDVRCMPIQALGQLADVQIFDGAFSNFGALNCVADLAGMSRDLVQIVRPSGILAICVMGRFSWQESIRFLLQGNIKQAIRRWNGQTEWRGISVYYRHRFEVMRAFQPHFLLIRRKSIGRGDHQLYIFRRTES